MSTNPTALQETLVALEQMMDNPAVDALDADLRRAARGEAVGARYVVAGAAYLRH